MLGRHGRHNTEWTHRADAPTSHPLAGIYWPTWSEADSRSSRRRGPHLITGRSPARAFHRSLVRDRSSAITRPGAITAKFMSGIRNQTAGATAIGADIGGTSIKAALVNPAGEVTLSTQVRTEASGGRDVIASSLCQALEQVLSAAHGRGIHPIGLGIASAGAMNARDGSVFAATDNLPGWAGFQLRQFVEERFHLPTRLVNDAHAAVLAELHYGLGRSLSDFVAITVGTGIGGGVVCNRKLLTGQHGFAGSIGHHVIREGGRPCNCGRDGCLEAYVSTAALIREYAERGGSFPDSRPADDAESRVRHQ